MKIDELAAILGGSVNGQWINVPGPGHSSKDRSLGIKFDPKAPHRLRVYSFAHDDAAACRSHVKRILRRLKLISHGSEYVVPNTEPEAIERIRRAQVIWEYADPASGTLAEKYLTARGCCLPSDIKAADVLRFHAFCRFGVDRVPAMIALMRHLITDEPTGVHRTALKDSGTAKRELPDGAKRMLGISRHAAVKLQPHNGVLGIAEGTVAEGQSLSASTAAKSGVHRVT
jgi:putative DNA primase/helicase